ncbi:hypothetical protein NQD34_004685 [Periophthalmus magnuspinnatus]|nr:hypothetical protein NQD34_004685 [Periophthalmus magnuspinnatus]
MFCGPGPSLSSSGWMSRCLVVLWWLLSCRGRAPLCLLVEWLWSYRLKWMCISPGHICSCPSIRVDLSFTVVLLEVSIFPTWFFEFFLAEKDTGCSGTVINLLVFC